MRLGVGGPGSGLRTGTERRGHRHQPGLRRGHDRGPLHLPVATRTPSPSPERLESGTVTAPWHGDARPASSLRSHWLILPGSAGCAASPRRPPVAAARGGLGSQQCPRVATESESSPHKDPEPGG
jgi:hypothetical protein